MRQLLLGGKTSCRAVTPNTSDGGAEKAVGQGTFQPGHGATVWLITFGSKF